MADDTLQLNTATTPGKLEDVESLVGAGGQTVIRQRVQTAGALLAEIQRVMNTDPTGSEYAAVVRSIISGTTLTPAYDAFTRLRTSSPFTLIDTVQRYDASPLYWDTIVVGSGSITQLPNQSAVQLNTTVANGDSIKFQTHNYLRYQPGKSQLVVFTGVLGAKTNNVVRRAGLYDDQNGLFFEVTGTDIAVVRRTFTSGSAVDVRTPQANWNQDKLDGTGPSGFTLDPSKIQLFFIDFQWLAVGIVRWGVEINGQQIICNIEYHANLISIPYMTVGSLPIRYELTNTGVAAGANTLLSVCSTVMSEGGQQILGTPFGVTSGTTAISVAAAKVPILSIRSALTYNGIPNRALTTLTDMECITDQNIVIEAWLNGTLTNPSFAAVDANSVMEFDTAATAITGGTRVFGGLVSSTAKLSGIGEVFLGLGKKQLSINAAGTVGDILTLTASKITTTANVFGAMNWIEER